MTKYRLHVLIAAAGSAALLLCAFYFQYGMGLAPCKLCIWQRWPHAAAVAIGALALATGQRALAWLGAAAAGLTGIFGVYHSGVERGFWEGPTTCTSSSPGALSSDELFNQILNAPLIRCDEIAWSFLGLSMASWNAIIAFALMLIWLRAATLPRD